MRSVANLADQFSSQWVTMRRHLHKHPELSGAEQQTTAYLATAIDQLGLPIEKVGEGRGLTADLVSSPEVADGPRFAIRGDIDALPIQDRKSVDYRSIRDGIMHACGHDAHGTIVFGAMQILTTMHRQGELPWPIAVRSIFQPSEETATGARYMIHHHALRDVTAVVALHVDPARAVGGIGLRSGTLTAACDMIHVQFTGRGGHGARPHLARDPIDACTRWVQSAFRRVARAVNPHQTVVISFGQVEAGHSANVIPDTASATGSLRSLDSEARRVALETLEDVCAGVQRETGCTVDMQLGASTPAVINDSDLTHLLHQSVIQMLNPGAVQPIDEPSMGSEDFSYYLEHIPGAMFRLGVAGEQVGQAPLHTSTFDIDERALAIGAQLFAATAINFFHPKRTQPGATARKI